MHSSVSDRVDGGADLYFVLRMILGGGADVLLYTLCYA